jgi:homoserine O-acetyltransferase
MSHAQTDALRSREPAIPATRGTISLDRLTLDGGGVLAPAVVAYEAWGALAPTRDNVILLCHALTGNAHAHDPAAPDEPHAGWWNPLIGPGRAFDTTRFFVLCANVLGGCAGSSGPTSSDPRDGRPYGSRFPFVSVGDIVRAQWLLLARLGVRRVHTVAGGSVGGLVALETAIAYPDFVDRAVIVAAGTRLSAHGIALNEIGRRAIAADPAWSGGDYAPGVGPAQGLAIARMVAMLSYTSAESLDSRFGRRPASRPTRRPSYGPAFDVESYLQYQGEKLVNRFDANSYLILTRAMDRYDAAEGRGSERAALARIRASTLAIGVSSDWLYPAEQVRLLAYAITDAGGRARYAELASPHGHDAFLKEWDQLDALIRPLVAGAAEPRAPP